MEKIINRSKYAFNILIPLILNFVILQFNLINDRVVRLFFYTITYVLIVLRILSVNEYKILSVQFLSTMFFSLSIGLGPIAHFIVYRTYM